MVSYTTNDQYFNHCPLFSNNTTISTMVSYTTNDQYFNHCPLFSNYTTISTLNLPQSSQYKSDFADCCVKQCAMSSFIEQYQSLPLFSKTQQFAQSTYYNFPNTSWISLIVVSNDRPQGQLSNNVLFSCAQWCDSSTTTLCFPTTQQFALLTYNNFSTTALALNVQEFLRYLSFF